jgi:DNA-nicking Smr family endonuclease
MGKDDKPKKADDFAHSPFRSLKGMKTVTGEPPKAKPAVVQPPPAPPDLDDAELFLRSVAGVRRLLPQEPPRHATRQEAVPSQQLPKGDDEGQQLFLRAVDKLDLVFHDELPDDVVPLHPQPSNRMRQLKRGAIRIDFELDLHGLTRDEAVQSLGQFISGAYNRGQKAVLVITGKGNNSPGEPVLLGAVAAWLREGGKAMVAEFSPAPKQLGGSGAFVVFLRDKSKGAELPHKTGPDGLA